MHTSSTSDVGALRIGAARPTPGSGALADAVLRLIWEQRAISRAEIARRADLSRSTVSDIVSMLLSTHLVSETGIGESRGGRRPIVLEFQDSACGILGVDMGATHVTVLLTDLRGRTLAMQHRDHPVRTDPVGTRALIAKLCEACLTTARIDRDSLVGIGVAVPSPIDPRYPDRLSALAMPAWDGKHGLQQLGAMFGVPLFIDNDANLGALAERWWGGARGLDDFAFIKVATGIGSGHFVNGRIYRGANGVAGEVGHLTIDIHGPPCVCGNRGCLVTYVGSHALVERAQNLFVKYPESVLAGTTPTANSIEEAALIGDPLAVQMMFEVADHLGAAVAGMLNLINPAAVIFGGGLARLGEQLLVPLREAVMRRTFVGAVASSLIKASELGSSGIALGAATLVLDAALQDPSLFPTVSAV